VELEAGTFEFRFSERIHIGNADWLREEILPHVIDATVMRIILNMESVQECASYGLKLLLDIHRHAQTLSKEVIIKNPTAIIADLLKDTKLNTVFTIISA
jgi:anti-anti-sigma factor